MEEVAFVLDNDGTGWPPAAVEWIYVEKVKGGYQVKTAPLFVKTMSVDDIVHLNRDSEGKVISWNHVDKSKRSTVWIMVHGGNNIDGVLKYLRSLGCNTESCSSHNYYAVDVPESVGFDKIDEALATVSEDAASVVHPSFRH